MGVQVPLLALTKPWRPQGFFFFCRSKPSRPTAVGNRLLMSSSPLRSRGAENFLDPLRFRALSRPRHGVMPLGDALEGRVAERIGDRPSCHPALPLTCG